VVPPSIDYDKFKNPTDNVRSLKKLDGLYGSVLTDMPLGVLALSAYVKEYTNAEVELIDFNAVLNRLESFPHSSFYEFFDSYISNQSWVDYNPTIIGISTLFVTSYQNMIDIAESCRKLFPEALIVGGGGVPTNMYEKIFSDTESFDVLIYGEGERPLVELIESPEKNGYLKESKSCITREKVNCGSKFEWDFIDDLDEIPMYDYDLIDLPDYHLNPTISAYPGVDSSRPHVTFMTSRGCPFKCTFCSAHSIHGRKMRYYSLDRMRAELQSIKQKYDVKVVVFQDDHFMSSKERVYEIFSILRELNLSAFFPNSLTLYALDRQMLEGLKSVGVNLLVLAVESGSARVLNKVMKKPLKLSIVERVLDDCHDLGIASDCNIIIGNPGETKEDIEDSRSFLKTLRATWFRVYVAVPLVGSEMYDLAVENGYLNEEFLNGDFKKAVIQTEDFSAEYIQQAAYDMNLELNFVFNGEVRRGNYNRALMEFENTIKVKSDHAFAYYYAAKCVNKLADKEKFFQYKTKFEEIVNESDFWMEYSTKFGLPPLQYKIDNVESQSPGGETYQGSALSSWKTDHFGYLSE
jgi:radical SAM superfamily enzyme YgiQ (UPF0313 family)